MTGTSLALTAVLLASLPFDEVSGLAVGERGLYVHEDSGNGPRFARVDRDGEVLQRYALPVDDVDWEDMAAAPDADGEPSLWFADVGDNRAERDEVQVHRVSEDAPEGPVTTYRLVYEDGPRDAEALLVLPGGEQVAVVSKDLGAAGVYLADLGDERGVLRRVTEVRLRPTGTRGGPAGAFGQLLVTGGAVSPDGRTLALRTYTDLYEWPLAGDLVATFAQQPLRTPLPATEQGEAVGYDEDGTGVLVASEGSDAPLHRLARTGLRPTSAAGPAPTRPGAPAASPGSSSPGAEQPASRAVPVGLAGLLAVALLLTPVLALARALLRRRARRRRG